MTEADSELGERHDDSRGVRFSSAYVYPHNVSKTAAAWITKLDIQMFHDQSWQPIYFGVRGFL